MTRALNRAVIFAIGAFFLLFVSTETRASNQPGITATVYNNAGFNQSPPLPPTNPEIGQVLVSNINQDFDSIQFFNLYEDFVVKYEGFITTPCSCSVRFMAIADDGTQLYLDNELITDDWIDKGGGGSVSEPVSFVQGVSKQITLWFYENGGSAWVQLMWLINESWEIVPDSAFSQAASTTTEQPTTTSILPTTTTQESTTTTTTVPDTVAPIVETPTTLIQTTTSTFSPSTISTTTSTLPLTTTLPSLPVSTSITTIPNENPQVVELTTEEALNIASDQKALEEVSGDEAAKIFSAIDENQLTPEQGEAIVAAVQDAPVEVREAFEEQIDIFAGNTDTYIPIGSMIPVSQRRSMIAITTVMSAAPIVARRRW